MAVLGFNDEKLKAKAECEIQKEAAEKAESQLKDLEAELINTKKMNTNLESQVNDMRERINEMSQENEKLKESQ